LNLYVRVDTNKYPLPFNYSSGKLNCSVNKVFAENLFSQTGVLFYIYGFTLMSQPDYTPVVIKEFNPVTTKNLTIEKENGSLKLINYCYTTGKLYKFKFIPELEASLRNNIISDNPLRIFIRTDEDQKLNLKITDIMGSPVLSEELSVTKDTESLELDLSRLPSGCYFISIKGASNKLFMDKFIILD